VIDDLDRRLTGSPYQGYTYGYPHKTAYRALTPSRPLAEVWAQEPKAALDLYIHIPYCEMRCGFCNLFTSVNPRADTLRAMLEQQIREADATARALGTARFSRMAIGGGTPTILSAEQLNDVLRLAASRFGVTGDAIPISVECSPETVTAEKLAILKAHGVTRVSIGVQAFDDEDTRRLGRPQRRADVEAALRLLADARFQTLNIDLIYGAEGQTQAEFLAAVDAALAYAPQELCLYPLYVRPLTGLGRRNGADMWADDQRLAHYRAARDRLEANGFAQANMRLFRRRGTAWDAGARHKSLTDGTVGIGCGARSLTSSLHYSSEYAVSSASVKSILATYLAHAPAHFNAAHYGTTLDAQARQRRHVILHLMETHGIDRRAFTATHGIEVDAVFPELSQLMARGLAADDGARVRLTPAGLERSDMIGPWLYGRDVTARMETYQWR
jgi:oxygen-independent coproporphyrinogen III oxidase